MENTETEKEIRFIDPRYRELFRIRDGDSIVYERPDAPPKLLPCAYIDDYHAKIGVTVFHICQFAEVCQNLGATVRPEHPDVSADFGTYEVYQAKAQRCPYIFRNYDFAKDRMKPSHYQKVYTGMLAKQMTLEELFTLHNRAGRPAAQSMRSMSVSDIVVLRRGKEVESFYVDSVGFARLPDDMAKKLERTQKKRKRMPLER